MKKRMKAVACAMLVAVCTLFAVACGEGGGNGMKEVTPAEFEEKVNALQEADAGYTGGTIKYYTRTTMFGLLEYEGGFTYANGDATLTDPENGNEMGREEAEWCLEHNRVWNKEISSTDELKMSEDGFAVVSGPFTYEYDANGYFTRETHTTLTENDWIIEITWTK